MKKFYKTVILLCFFVFSLLFLTSKGYSYYGGFPSGYSYTSQSYPYSGSYPITSQYQYGYGSYGGYGSLIPPIPAPTFMPEPSVYIGEVNIGGGLYIGGVNIGGNRSPWLNIETSPIYPSRGSAFYGFPSSFINSYNTYRPYSLYPLDPPSYHNTYYATLEDAMADTPLSVYSYSSGWDIPNLPLAYTTADIKLDENDDGSEINVDKGEMIAIFLASEKPSSDGGYDLVLDTDELDDGVVKKRNEWFYGDGYHMFYFKAEDVGTTTIKIDNASGDTFKVKITVRYSASTERSLYGNSKPQQTYYATLEDAMADAPLYKAILIPPPPPKGFP
ncbi:MAG: hypothetical protein ACMUJM_19275 [bacterium]